MHPVEQESSVSDETKSVEEPEILQSKLAEIEEEKAKLQEFIIEKGKGLEQEKAEVTRQGILHSKTSLKKSIDR